MTDDLVARLLAAIGTKEQQATDAHFGKWQCEDVRHEIRAGNGGEVAAVFNPKDIRFIVDNQPATVLRRCAADRKIVELHKQAEPPYLWMCDLCRDEGQNIDCTYPCDTLRLLAEGYGLMVAL